MSAVASYDKKYSGGGWTYREPGERKHLEIMLKAAGLEPPASIIEVACGMGFHTNLLHQMGFRVVGNDYSEIGIHKAQQEYPDIRFVWGDSQKLPETFGRDRFDAVMARGHSHHHYDLPLSGKSRKGVDVVASTKSMFELIKPGGAMMMTIRTSFAGDDYSDGVVNNELAAYASLFSRFGSVETIMDLEGTAIIDDAHARELGKKPNNGIILVARKPSQS